MFPHSKFNDSESTSLLRILREQERMADKKLAYPLEKIEPSVRSNALPPLGAKATSSSTSTKAPTAPPLSHSTSQACARKSQRKFSDELMKYETRRECFGVDQNQNARQRRDFDACLDDAVRKHEEDKLFTKQRSLETSDDSRVRRRMERPKSAHYGRRRPQTSLGSYPERIDLSFNE